MTASFRRPPTAQEAVLAQLRQWIAVGRLRPGDQIRQDALAAELGVSRVPLREALKILEGEGQITYVARRGYFVTRLSLDDLLEVYRIRELLEAEAVRLSVAALSSEGLQQLELAGEQVVEAAAAGDMAAMTAANRRFHLALIDSCGMPRLIRLIEQLWDATEVYRLVYFSEQAHRDVAVAEHRAVVDAVRAGDSEAALAVLGHHREHAIEALRPVLRRLDEAAAAGTVG
ncbi:MAG TPA: GntR family transcriptional regulator [Actinomycetes bacterium]|nr:GntR family transcriptional regulator [Actinomycetes bacterium]